MKLVHKPLTPRISAYGAALGSLVHIAIAQGLGAAVRHAHLNLAQASLTNAFRQLAEILECHNNPAPL